MFIKIFMQPVVICYVNNKSAMNDQNNWKLFEKQKRQYINYLFHKVYSI